MRDHFHQLAGLNSTRHAPHSPILASLLRAQM